MTDLPVNPIVPRYRSDVPWRESMPQAGSRCRHQQRVRSEGGIRPKPKSSSIFTMIEASAGSRAATARPSRWSGVSGLVQGQDAMQAARLLRAEGIRSLLVDTSRRPRPRARELASEMGAEYVPLPFADAATISASVQRGVA